ncbi:helix-turn-helix domain-containing protein [Nocardia sp. bgisy134]
MLPVEVMPVARKPDVFGRAVTPEEGRKLAQIARRSKVPVRMRRAVVVMASAQHQPVGAIAKLMQVSEAYVRQVIHDFNAHGFEALDPKWSGGRPAKTTWSARLCIRTVDSAHLIRRSLTSLSSPSSRCSASVSSWPWVSIVSSSLRFIASQVSCSCLALSASMTSSCPVAPTCSPSNQRLSPSSSIRGPHSTPQAPAHNSLYKTWRNFL